MLHQIGAGVLGPVFRAYDPDRDRLVAVKLFRLNIAPDRVHRLVAEFDKLIAAELTHPAIVAPVATGISDTNGYLVQEYVAADSLDVAVREYGHAPVADALRVAAQLAGALDFAAVVDVAHGALHPRDVLLASDDTRVTGVGVAQALERIGTPAPVRRPYAAPERVAGGAWDRRADIFSLAAVIHELMFGRRLTGTGQQAAQSLPEADGADVPRLRAAFARALAEDPAARFDTALEFVEAVKAAFPSVTLTPAAPRATKPLPPLATFEEPRLPLEPPAPDMFEPAIDFESAIDAHPAIDSEPAIVLPEPAGPDLDMRASEEPRFADLEQEAPAMIDPSVAPPDHGPLPPPTTLMSTAEPFSSLDRAARTAVWPLVLALSVGVALGFAAGYGVGTRDRASAPVVASVAPAGQEFTEGTVPTAARPSTTPAKPSDDPRPKPDAATERTAPTPTSTGRATAPLAGSPRSETSGVRSPSEAATRNQANALPGRLLIRSTPNGAQVFVDGREYGRTPATVRELTTGPHMVRIVHDGFAAGERRIVLTPARPAQSMAFSLERSRAAAKPAAPAAPPATQQFVGTLSIESRPSGARVFMDNTLAGTTPLALPSVAAGSHAIRLERDGYRHWSSSVRVVAGEQNRVTASLER